MQRVSCKRRHLGSCVTDTWPNLTPSMNFRRYAPASDGIPATKSLHDFDHLFFFCELHNTSETLTTHTHPYEYTHANPTPRSIFEDCAGKSSRLTKSPHATRCRREHRLPLKAQTLLNLEKFAPTGSRTQDLRSYRGSCNC
jgi:hypothetical protein